jgi:hypothetical protein
VEFAFVIPIILFLVFGTMELGRHYYVRLTLQQAVSEAARFAVTGNVLADSTGTPFTRVESITEMLRRRASTLNVDMERVSVDPPDGGGPGDVVTIFVDFHYQFFAPPFNSLVPQGAFDFSVSTAMKNEPFFPAPTSAGG